MHGVGTSAIFLALWRVQFQAVGQRTVLIERIDDADLFEGAQCGAGQGDTGAIDAPVFVDLDQVDLAPQFSQLNSCAHAGDSATDYQHFAYQGHCSP